MTNLNYFESSEYFSTGNFKLHFYFMYARAKSYSEELSRTEPKLLTGGTFYYAQICLWNLWPCLLLILRGKWESVGLGMHD